MWCFALVLLFQVVTLSVEFNASHRALRMLNNGA
ncbi:zinc metallopeptidase, partial [Bacillus thuringiensis]